MRKLWNPRNFKAHVSPHEMLQAVVLWSRKKFQFTEQGELESFSRLVSSWSRKESSTVLLIHFKSYICVCPAVSYKCIKPFSQNSVIMFGYLRINLYPKSFSQKYKIKTADLKTKKPNVTIGVSFIQGLKQSVISSLLLIIIKYIKSGIPINVKKLFWPQTSLK